MYLMLNWRLNGCSLQVKVVKMLVVVVLVFTMSWLPLYVIFARIKFGGEFERWEGAVLSYAAPIAQWYVGFFLFLILILLTHIWYVNSVLQRWISIVSVIRTLFCGQCITSHLRLIWLTFSGECAPAPWQQCISLCKWSVLNHNVLVWTL